MSDDLIQYFNQISIKIGEVADNTRSSFMRLESQLEQINGTLTYTNVILTLLCLLFFVDIYLKWKRK
ncbi:hypothetical protein P4H65_08295 [Paenibacillus chitinolyticus]|uniref:hypothetical protein n=1 Tax=Paenibacillus chitinolyticus TaxID=79263 RepID=UPI002DBAB2FC|nr:hypothetical protein [Paenibacillus chitinolyticus]MEC0245794.1 hypothetical protein [Paenibacillus chitinolyticus]